MTIEEPSRALATGLHCLLPLRRGDDLTRIEPGTGGRIVARLVAPLRDVTVADNSVFGVTWGRSIPGPKPTRQRSDSRVPAIRAEPKLLACLPVLGPQAHVWRGAAAAAAGVTRLGAGLNMTTSDLSILNVRDEEVTADNARIFTPSLPSSLVSKPHALHLHRVVWDEAAHSCGPIPVGGVSPSGDGRQARWRRFGPNTRQGSLPTACPPDTPASRRRTCVRCRPGRSCPQGTPSVA